MSIGGMYLQDNTNNVAVIDFGSALIRAGPAGCAFPTISHPSVLYYCEDDSVLGYTGKSAISQRPLFDESYSFTSNDVLDSVIKKLDQGLSVEASSTPLLFSEPIHVKVLQGNDYHNRQSLEDVVFENLSHPSMLMVPDAMLASLAHCSSTSLVVEFGWSSIRIVPVIGGHIHKKAIRSHHFGGYAIAQQIISFLESKNVTLHTSPTESLKKAAEIFKDEVHFGYMGEEEKKSILKTPDGSVDITGEINFLSDILWYPIEDISGNSTVPSLQEQIKQSISACPQEAQKTLWTSIVTSGGFSRIQGFPDELERRIQSVAPDKIKPRVIYPMHPSIFGSFTVWTGGSIFGASPAFSTFAATRSEWLEHGEEIMHVKYSF